MKISDIIIGERHRREMGDIDGLAESIRTKGLLQAIGVTPAKELIFGYRRLVACRDRLSWAEIDAKEIDLVSIVDGEFTENEMRKDFTPSERVAIKKSIEEEIGNRQGQRTDQLSDNYHEVVEPGERTLAAAARLAGFGSGFTARQAETVVEVGTPELVAAMDRGEIKISAAAIIAKKPAEEQRRVIALPKRERRAVVREGRAPVSTVRRQVPSPKMDAAREAIRPLVEAGESVDRHEWAKRLGVSHITIEEAEAYELGRIEGRLEAIKTRTTGPRKRFDPPQLSLGTLPTGAEIDAPPPGASWSEKSVWRDKVGAKVVLHPLRIRQLDKDVALAQQMAQSLRMIASEFTPTIEEFEEGIERMLAHVHQPDSTEPGDRTNFAKVARDVQRSIDQHLDVAFAKLESYRAAIHRIGQRKRG